MVRIRLANDGDAEAIAAIYRPVVEHTAISFETIAPDRHEISRRLSETMTEYPWLVCDFFNAFAGIALPNPASVGLHEAMGFQKLGVYRNVGFKFGEWRDVGWWQLTLRQQDMPASAPLAVSEVERLPGWSRLLALGEGAVHDRARVSA